MVILILIFLGLCLGSFINAYVWRLHEQEELRGRVDELEYELEKLEQQKLAAAARAKAAAALEKEIAGHRASIRQLSIWRGRSKCGHCGHELSAADLIPVVSYLALNRKCRYCGKPIEDTPLAEVAVPALFVISYLFWPHNLQGGQLVEFGVWLLCLVGFVALAMYDLRWKILPTRIILPLIALALVSIIVQVVFYDGGDKVAAQAFWGVLAVSGIFRVLYEVSEYLRSIGRLPSAWIGFGDVRLGVLLGLLVGGPGKGLLLLFVASLIGTLVSVPLIASGRATRRTHIPYGPFLIVAAVIVQLWGASLLSWYSAQLLL